MLFSFLFVFVQQTYQACIHVHVVCEAHCADGRECTVQGAFIIDKHAVFLVLFCILLMLCYKILHFSKHFKKTPPKIHYSRLLQHVHMFHVIIKCDGTINISFRFRFIKFTKQVTAAEQDTMGSNVSLSVESQCTPLSSSIMRLFKVDMQGCC